MSITKEEYLDRLQNKFKHTNLVGRYFGYTRPTEHSCRRCKHIYRVKPRNQISSHRKYLFCGNCSIKQRASIQKNQKYEEFKQQFLEKFGSRILLLEYFGKDKKSKFKCNCGNIWAQTPYQVLHSKYGCPKCASYYTGKSNRLTHKQFLDRFRKPSNKSASIRVLGKYVSSNTPIRVKCKICNYKWQAKPNNLITGTGCPMCAKVATSKNFLSTKKTIKIGSRRVTVLGAEDKAIEFLKKVMLIKPNKISVFSEGKIPIINYRFNKELKEYWPDIKIGNCLIEVKSSYTLLRDWDRNIAKAKACIKQGFDFRLLLVDNKKRYFLPENWHLNSKTVTIEYIHKLSAKSIKILSIDPGTKNAAWAALRISRKTFKMSLLSLSSVENTLQSAIELNLEDVQKFIREIEDIIDEYKIEAIILERFMARNRIKNTTMELVNIMIGIIASIALRYRIPISLITAAQWKNSLNRYLDIEKLYKRANCTSHQVDSIGIGMYWGSVLFNQKRLSTNMISQFKRILNAI